MNDELTRRNVVLALIILSICSTAVFAQEAKISTAWPPATPIDGLGVQIHMTNPGPGNIERYKAQMDKAAEMGLKFVRCTNKWRWTDKSKWEYDFQPHHTIVDACEKRGLRVLTLVTWSHPKYDKTSSIKTPEGRKAFAKFCARLVGEFKGRGIVWEMWNEPNVGMFWPPNGDVNEYMAAIMMAIKAMREADPDCIIVAPSTSGASGPAFSYLESCFKQGLLEHIDGVAVHPYGEVPEVNLLRYLPLQNLINRYSPKLRSELPIVNTELGFPQVMPTTAGHIVRSQKKQAALNMRSVLIDFAAGIPMRIIYTLRDYDDKLDNLEHSLGLLTYDEKPKAGYHAVKTLTSQLKGMKFEGMFEAGKVDTWERLVHDYVLVFGDDDTVVIATWTSIEPHISSIQIPGIPIEVVDMQGKKLIIPPTTDPASHPGFGRKMLIKLTEEPVYIRIKKADFDTNL